MGHKTRRFIWVTIVFFAAALGACAPAVRDQAPTLPTYSQQSASQASTTAPTLPPVTASPADTPTRRPTPTWVATLPIITPTITPTPRPTAPPPTPMPKTKLLELLAQSEAAMQALDSFYMDSQAQVAAGGAALSVTSASQIELPDKVYTTTDAAGTKVESVQIGEESHYRTLDSADWFPASTSDVVIPRIANPLAELQLANLGADLNQLQDKRVDGALCYRFAFDMDLDEFLARTGYRLEDLMLADVNPPSVRLKREIWIGQTDLLLRLALTELSFTYEGKPFEMAITNYVHSFDQPVDIPTP